MLSVATDAQAHDELRLDLDELVREGARRMLAAALEAEVDDYLAAHAGERDEGGRRLVVRNGHARQRTVTTAAGAVAVRAPRVNDRRVDPVTGGRVRFRSVILPPWCRKSPKVAEVLPLLYLHGMSSGDFVPALEGFFGAAAGLSALVITRLTVQWQAEREAFMARSLADRDDIYVWADGVHFNVRLAEERRCTLHIIGVRTDGTKELVAVADGLGWVDRVVGGVAGRSAPARHAGTGAGGWRRRPWAVGGAARCVPRHPDPALLGPQKLEGNNVSFSVFGLAGVVCAACASRWRSVVNSPPGSRCCCRTSTSASSAWRWRSRRGCWGVVACARSRRWLASARRPSARACSSWRPARSRSRPAASAGQVGDASKPLSRTPTSSQPCWRWSSRTSAVTRNLRCGGRPSRCGTWPRSSPGRAIRSPPRRWADC